MKRDRVVDLKEFKRICRHGTVDELREMLDIQGADPNECSAAFSRKASTPLMMVCTRRDGYEQARMLCEEYRAAPRLSNVQGQTAVHFACHYSCVEVVDLLVRQYGVSPTQRDIYGDTPLHDAAVNDRDIVLYLLTHYKVNVNAPRDGNVTPLMCTVRNNTTDIAAALITHGANVNLQTKKIQKTALMYACERRDRMDMIALLLGAGAKPKTVDHTNRSAMHYAFGVSVEYMRRLAPHYANETFFLCEQPTGSTDRMRCIEYAIEQRWYKPRDGVSWAAIRVKEDAAKFIPEKIIQTENEADWYWWGRELQSQRFTGIGCTLMHLAASSPHAHIALPVLGRLGLNPHYKTTTTKETALDMAKTDASRSFLRIYMRWRPSKQITAWFGPYFVKRARVFLLVCMRLKPGFNHDVRHKIIEFIAENECTHI